MYVDFSNHIEYFNEATIIYKHIFIDVLFKYKLGFVFI